VAPTQQPQSPKTARHPPTFARPLESEAQEGALLVDATPHTLAFCGVNQQQPFSSTKLEDDWSSLALDEFFVVDEKSPMLASGGAQQQAVEQASLDADDLSDLLMTDSELVDATGFLKELLASGASTSEDVARDATDFSMNDVEPLIAEIERSLKDDREQMPSPFGTADDVVWADAFSNELLAN